MKLINVLWKCNSIGCTMPYNILGDTYANLKLKHTRTTLLVFLERKFSNSKWFENSCNSRKS